jgi:hypothetical protein
VGGGHDEGERNVRRDEASIVTVSVNRRAVW